MYGSTDTSKRCWREDSWLGPTPRLVWTETGGGLYLVSHSAHTFSRLWRLWRHFRLCIVFLQTGSCAGFCGWTGVLSSSPVLTICVAMLLKGPTRLFIIGPVSTAMRAALSLWGAAGCISWIPVPLLDSLSSAVSLAIMWLEGGVFSLNAKLYAAVFSSWAVAAIGCLPWSPSLFTSTADCEKSCFNLFCIFWY